MSKKVLDFADWMAEAEKKIRLSTVKRRGQKSVGRSARVALSRIKKEIPNIKRAILENEKGNENG